MTGTYIEVGLLSLLSHYPTPVTTQKFIYSKKSVKPDLKHKLSVYKTLDINERINLKSWFYFRDYLLYKNPFYHFINQSLVLVNIYNNQYYLETLNTKIEVAKHFK